VNFLKKPAEEVALPDPELSDEEPMKRIQDSNEIIPYKRPTVRFHDLKFVSINE
jgi:hypothetical protein